MPSCTASPEVISRIGNKGYAAVNKGSLGSMLRAAVLTGNIGGYGAISDQMRAVEPKYEADTRTLAETTAGSMLAKTTANKLPKKSPPAFLFKLKIWGWST